jgi:uncharacterized coiled-coil protein SlyX
VIVAALETRVEKLEERVDEHDVQLAEGGKQFVAVGKDIAHLTEKVSALIDVLTWVGGAIGLGLLATAGTALVWVLGNMGSK